MAYRNLVVGDVHATPDDLDDCERLLELVLATAQQHAVAAVTFTGDTYNTHDVLNVRVVAFWRRWFQRLGAAGYRVCDVLGNHDQVAPTQRFPHAMESHPEVDVYDAPRVFLEVDAHEAVVALPYYHDNAEFLDNADSLATAFPSAHTLFCHQTFQGAAYENGFYAKDAVDLAALPAAFKTVISGHIHTPQKVGRVVYVGAPRARTRADVNVERYLWVLEHGPTATRPVARVATGTACRRLWAYDDRPDAPVVVPAAYDRAKDRLWVDVYGPDEAVVRAREGVLKAAYGAVTRPFPDRFKRSAVTEAAGVEVAFQKFLAAFQAPYGTTQARLAELVGARLGA